MTDQKTGSNQQGTFMRIIKSPFKLKLFFLKRLPMAFLAGLRVPAANAQQASVSVSMGYLTKNPFRSIYFACLAMAAELSTGILAMNAIEQTGHKFSVLVVHLEAEFTKKAVGQITFQSNDGPAMISTVKNCLDKNEAGTVTANSIGTNEKGELVAEFSVTWSFKPKI